MKKSHEIKSVMSIGGGHARLVSGSCPPYRSLPISQPAVAITKDFPKQHSDLLLYNIRDLINA
jgi:hypothetical protein